MSERRDDSSRSDSLDDGARDDGAATLELPSRARTPQPSTPAQVPFTGVTTFACGAAAFVLGLLAYRWLASRPLDLFMFRVGRFDHLIGMGWSDVVAYLYASGCCLGGIATQRWLAGLGLSSGRAGAAGVVLAVSVAVGATLVAVAFVTMVLAVFGILVLLFLHGGDR